MNRVLLVPEDLTGLRANVGLAKPLGLSCVKVGKVLT